MARVLPDRGRRFSTETLQSSGFLAPSPMRKYLSTLILVSLSLLAACGKTGNDFVIDPNGDSYNSAGTFFVEGSNMLDGMFWQLNRPIRIDFNHPIDPDSVNFGTVQIRSTDPQAIGNPVTGTFELDAGSGGRTLIFRPTCPTNETNDNGAFMPGGITYELDLPTQSDSPTVLRDTTGHPLSSGLHRTFTTPPPSQPQFLDLFPGPPGVSSVTFPKGLNFFADPDPVVSIRFNQSIDGRASNLNNSNLTLLYADGEIGTANQDIFPAGNRVPGQLVLVENCTDAGALVEFRVTGILPVNRKLQLQMSSQFGDLTGQRNSSMVILATHTTPTLAAVYNDPSWVETDPTVDEFRDDFDNTLHLNLAEPIPLPLAQVSDGFIAANFDYPGTFVTSDADFYLGTGVSAEIFTDSQTVFTDSNNRQHTLQNGVLNVHNFTIEAGATLRGRGSNPLVIYATGEIVINGTLNVSGNLATWPSSLNSPWFVEGGAGGECGGGRGGDASQIGNAETPRAMDGDGPFFITGGGGGGGEGGFNSDTTAGGIVGLNTFVVGGGGGGGFAVTENVSVLWDQWSRATGWVPAGVDNEGPDHIITKHTQMVPTIGVTPDNPNGNGIFGAEDGMRGVSAWNNLPLGVLQPPMGMEDATNDPVIDNIGIVNDPDYDPAWTTGSVPPFDFGHPTQGPDPGLAGPSVFRNDLTGLNTLNDFWGSRIMDDGSVVIGELLTPWAGSGGGGSGDSMEIMVYDADNDGVDDPLLSFYPVVPFQKAANSVSQGWRNYRKGAGGGGGGGQCLLMAIGMIRIGANGQILANGGIGFSGESIIYTDNGISGSGGGSGGHLVLHSATGLDLSAIDVGVANNASQVGNLIPTENIQAFGGRRGWAGPDYTISFTDGNPTFGVGRGGAGANGVIQIHVPDPTTDILWHPNAAPGINDYITTSPSGIPTDRVEEMLNLYTAPQAYSLIPFFSSSSMVVSEWIDTGMAELRLGDANTYPKYGDPLLDFNGIFPSTGLVAKTGGDTVAPLADVATGATSAVTFDAFQLTIPSASTFFDAKFLRLPNLLVGYDVLPNAAGSATFEIVDAAYDRTADILTLSTATTDSPMTFALDNGNPVWSVKEKFFRIDTNGVKNSLPASTSVKFEFQGADELSPGSGLPGVPFGGANNWVTDLSLLNGQRFIRYRVTFEADAQGTGIDLSSPLPVLDYIKLPFVW